MEGPLGHADEATVRAFLDGLERHCSAYCLLGAANDLPAAVHSDIDFMVSVADFERLPLILSSVAEAAGFRLVQALRHETTACYFVLARSEPGRVLYLHPDAAADYRRSGRTWLRAEAMLARRRSNARGFSIPAAADNFHYYLVKSINKERLEERQAQELGRLFSEDPQGCSEVLALRFGRASAGRLATACTTGAWQPVFDTARALNEEMMARVPADGLGTRVREMRRRLLRWARPTGLWIAVLGPDGSGKSTVLAQLEGALAPGFRRTARFHLRPRLLGGTGAGEAASTDPHGQRPRGIFASTLKLLYLWADYVLGYWVRVRPQLVRSTLVLFDRYFADLLIDPMRFRHTGPRWLVRLVGALMPMPDLLLILDAHAEVLQARKQEVTVEESARQAEAYRRFAASAAARGRAALVDAACSPDGVVSACATRALELMAKRTARRLRTETSKL
jgi:thymidylate kinase